MGGSGVGCSEDKVVMGGWGKMIGSDVITLLDLLSLL